MSFGWEAEKVRLVPLDKEKYLENAVTWINDPKITECTLLGDWPLTRLAEEEWFDKTCKDDTKTRVGLAIETLEAGDHIGFTRIDRIEWPRAVGVIGSIIGPKECRGRGFRTDAIKVRTCYAFDVVNLRLLISEAFADNVASLKALKNAAYREAARIPRHYWRRGAYLDVVLLTIERAA